MNENPDANGSEDLKETCAALRHQLNSALILLLVVSTTMTIFFLRQVTLSNREKAALRSEVMNYQTNAIPALQDFTRKLQDYARTHPDVMPILLKYGAVPTAPAPAPAAPKK